MDQQDKDKKASKEAQSIEEARVAVATVSKFVDLGKDTGYFDIGLDTGESDGKTVACYVGVDGRIQHQSFNTPAEALEAWGGKKAPRLCVESSVYGFHLAKRQGWNARARELGIELYPLSPRVTSGRRRTWGGLEKSDQADATVLLGILKEGVVPHALKAWERSLKSTGDGVLAAERPDREEHEVLLINVRRHGLEHPSTRAAHAAVERLRSHVPPMDAVTAKLAEVMKRTGLRWKKTSYLSTIAVVAATATSKRSALALVSRRGRARADLMHHPLKGTKKKPFNPAQATEVKRAQRRVLKWAFDALRKTA